MTRTHWVVGGVAVFLCGALLGPLSLRIPAVHSVWVKFKGRRTVEDRLAEHGADARARMAPAFAREVVTYPPAKVAIAGFKSERRLDVYAAGADGAWKFIRSFPFTAASGKLGPKLRQGDLQVPEGVYGISFLNPNSAFHLSLRVDYPNEFDRKQAGLEKRTELGGDIMIHGRAASIGCIAIGDVAIEELFVLAADVGIANLICIISPKDFRLAGPTAELTAPIPWLEELYANIDRELRALPRPEEGSCSGASNGR